MCGIGIRWVSTRGREGRVRRGARGSEGVGGGWWSGAPSGVGSRPVGGGVAGACSVWRGGRPPLCVHVVRRMAGLRRRTVFHLHEHGVAAKGDPQASPTTRAFFPVGGRPVPVRLRVAGASATMRCVTALRTSRSRTAGRSPSREIAEVRSGRVSTAKRHKRRPSRADVRASCITAVSLCAGVAARFPKHILKVGRAACVIACLARRRASTGWRSSEQAARSLWWTTCWKCGRRTT